MKYYVFQDNGIIGPLTEEEIINNPNFNIDTLIQPENTEYWYKMRFLFKEVEDSKSTLQSIQSKENNQTETLNFTATDIIALPATINDDNDDLEIDKISKSSENEIVEKKLIDFIIIEANQKIDLIQKQFYSFLNNLDDYFEYRQLLEKRKIQIIVESLKKYYSENFSVLQKGVTDFIEFKV
ncbi:MAG TPA: hypothetical protein PLJ38_02965, partial [bacterium]|nr:hypothetical protein [bacterium]